MNNKTLKFYTLLDKWYATRSEAAEAETALLEAGYSLGNEYIREWDALEVYPPSQLYPAEYWDLSPLEQRRYDQLHGRPCK